MSSSQRQDRNHSEHLYAIAGSSMIFKGQTTRFIGIDSIYRVFTYSQIHVTVELKQVFSKDVHTSHDTTPAFFSRSFIWRLMVLPTYQYNRSRREVLSTDEHDPVEEER